MKSREESSNFKQYNLVEVNFISPIHYTLLNLLKQKWFDN